MNHFDRTQPNILPPNILPRRAAAQAFTLIEILIVIALTAVLFALLLVPLISALRYTQQAQIVTAAQDAARITEERISRELGSAIFVFDGTSHPFQTANPIVAGDDRYTNFLDLPILSSTGTPVIAHAYNAKIDFVLPKLNANGATIDPTTNEPIAYSQSQNGSAIISNPSYVFPLAAGTSMTRYFIGLRNPALSYNNTREGKTISGSNGSNDNTYILYRAEFQPYIKNTAGTGVMPNTALFATRNNSNGVPIPELDDPDFFRYVSTNDVNWLNDSHVNYTAAEVTAHNARVDKWVQISKPVIPGPNVDLILLPHNADNTLSYDTGTAITPTASAPGFCTATSCPAIAHSGIAHDPVAGGYYPIINTSCTFRPATISGNATPGTTANYNSQGVVAADQAGFTYIPTVYTATSQSWSLPYHVSVFPGTYGQASTTAAINDALNMYYDTEQFASAPVLVTKPSSYPPMGVANTALSINPGDILEYSHVPSTANSNPQSKLAYDVTQGFPVKYDGTNYVLGGTQFVPMTINPYTGTISFTAPSLPNGSNDRLTRKWNYAPVVDADDPSLSIVDLTQPGFTDLTLTTANSSNPSPLTNLINLTPTNAGPVTGDDNAHPVPGSVRVYGPDQTLGPNKGNIVPYSEVSSSVGSSTIGTIGNDQYSVDYAHNRIDLQAGAPGPIQVIYDYQANMTLMTPLPNPPPSAALPVNLPSNPYLPMQVTVDYQTRDLIDVSIGVRIYDVTNNRAQVIPAETKIKIGNSNK